MGRVDCEKAEVRTLIYQRGNEGGQREAKEEGNGKTRRMILVAPPTQMCERNCGVEFPSVCEVSTGLLSHYYLSCHTLFIWLHQWMI